jgi:molybdate transport system substrate-binding protein
VTDASWRLAAFGVMVGSIACSRSEAAPTKAKEEVVRVAAASDLAGTLEELESRFERRTGAEITVSFGSSGLFAKQLEQGAPFDVFLAANASFVDRAVQSGACDETTRGFYARGRLGLFTKGDAGGPASIRDLSDPSYRRIAIANPEHAPYGQAAREALTKSDLWGTLEPRIVYAENVRQALQMAESGNADAAIVSFSHAERAKGGSALEVDRSLYTPLDQMLVVCKNGKNAVFGAAFARFVASPEARDVFSKGGFMPPSQGSQ